MRIGGFDVSGVEPSHSIDRGPPELKPPAAAGILADSPPNQTLLRPEWIRVLRERNKVKGCRLISFDSLKRFSRKRGTGGGRQPSRLH